MSGAYVPAGKKVLNTHISEAEYDFLKKRAKEMRTPLTVILRELIRKEMDRLKASEARTP